MKHNDDSIRKIIQFQIKQDKKNIEIQNKKTEELEKRLLKEKEFANMKNALSNSSGDIFDLESIKPKLQTNVCDECLDKEIYYYHICKVTPGLYGNDYECILIYDKLELAENVLKALNENNVDFTVFEIKKVLWVDPVTIISDSVENKYPILADINCDLDDEPITEEPMPELTEEREEEIQKHMKGFFETDTMKKVKALIAKDKLKL